MAARRPQLGVFWIVGKRIVAFTEPAEGVPVESGFKDSNLAHWRLWEAAVRAEPSLRGKEYWERPRGRILYSAAEDQFRLFLPNKYGCNQRLIRRIAARFSLPISKVRVCFDEHYEPPCEPEDE